MSALTGVYCSETESSDVTISSTPAANLTTLGIPDTQLLEIKQSYQDFISANPDGEIYTYYRIVNDTTTLVYDGEKLSAVSTTITTEDISKFLVKRHQICLNRNNSLKCQGCSGKFLGYSSAHNCNGKNVSCCTPQGPSGFDYGCVCYKRNQAMKQDLGSAGCCS